MEDDYYYGFVTAVSPIDSSSEPPPAPRQERHLYGTDEAERRSNEKGNCRYSNNNNDTMMMATMATTTSEPVQQQQQQQQRGRQRQKQQLDYDDDEIMVNLTSVQHQEDGAFEIQPLDEEAFDDDDVFAAGGRGWQQPRSGRTATTRRRRSRSLGKRIGEMRRSRSLSRGRMALQQQQQQQQQHGLDAEEKKEEEVEQHHVERRSLFHHHIDDEVVARKGYSNGRHNDAGGCYATEPTAIEILLERDVFPSCKKGGAGGGRNITADDRNKRKSFRDRFMKEESASTGMAAASHQQHQPAGVRPKPRGHSKKKKPASHHVGGREPSPSTRALTAARRLRRQQQEILERHGQKSSNNGNRKNEHESVTETATSTTHTSSQQSSTPQRRLGGMQQAQQQTQQQQQQQRGQAASSPPKKASPAKTPDRSVEAKSATAASTVPALSRSRSQPKPRNHHHRPFGGLICKGKAVDVEYERAQLAELGLLDSPSSSNRKTAGFLSQLTSSSSPKIVERREGFDCVKPPTPVPPELCAGDDDQRRQQRGGSTRQIPGSSPGASPLPAVAVTAVGMAAGSGAPSRRQQHSETFAGGNVLANNDHHDDNNDDSDDVSAPMSSIVPMRRPDSHISELSLPNFGGSRRDRSSGGLDDVDVETVASKLHQVEVKLKSGRKVSKREILNTLRSVAESLDLDHAELFNSSARARNRRGYRSYRGGDDDDDDDTGESSSYRNAGDDDDDDSLLSDGSEFTKWLQELDPDEISNKGDMAFLWEALSTFSGFSNPKLPFASSQKTESEGEDTSSLARQVRHEDVPANDKANNGAITTPASSNLVKSVTTAAAKELGSMIGVENCYAPNRVDSVKVPLKGDWWKHGASSTAGGSRKSTRRIRNPNHPVNLAMKGIVSPQQRKNKNQQKQEREENQETMSLSSIEFEGNPNRQHRTRGRNQSAKEGERQGGKPAAKLTPTSYYSQKKSNREHPWDPSQDAIVAAVAADLAAGSGEKNQQRNRKGGTIGRRRSKSLGAPSRRSKRQPGARHHAEYFA